MKTFNLRKLMGTRKARVIADIVLVPAVALFLHFVVGNSLGSSILLSIVVLISFTIVAKFGSKYSKEDINKEYRKSQRQRKTTVATKI